MPDLFSYASPVFDKAEKLSNINVEIVSYVNTVYGRQQPAKRALTDPVFLKFAFYTFSAHVFTLSPFSLKSVVAC